MTNWFLVEFLTGFGILMFPLVTIGDVQVWRRSKGHARECPVIKDNPWKFYAIRNVLEIFLFLGGLWVGVVLALH